MKTPLLVRVAALVASLTVTLALVQSIALFALPPHAAGPLFAQAIVGVAATRSPGVSHANLGTTRRPVTAATPL
jgi:hypothetical protein